MSVAAVVAVVMMLTADNMVDLAAVVPVDLDILAPPWLMRHNQLAKTLVVAVVVPELITPTRVLVEMADQVLF